MSAISRSSCNSPSCNSKRSTPRIAFSSNCVTISSAIDKPRNHSNTSATSHVLAGFDPVLPKGTGAGARDMPESRVGIALVVEDLTTEGPFFKSAMADSRRSLLSRAVRPRSLSISSPVNSRRSTPAIWFSSRERIMSAFRLFCFAHSMTRALFQLSTPAVDATTTWGAGDVAVDVDEDGIGEGLTDKPPGGGGGGAREAASLDD